MPNPVLKRRLVRADLDANLTYFNSTKNNFSATSAPATTDDRDGGYTVGSLWIDTAADKAYICVDSTPGSAVWVEAGNSEGSIYATNAVGCLVYNNTTQSIPSGSFTTISFNSEWADDWAMHDPSTNPKRITITKAGTYLITVSAQLTGASTGTYIIRMFWYDASASSTIVVRDERKPIAATGDTGFTVSAVLPEMEVDDYVYFQVFQNSGSTATVAASSSTNLYGCSASAYRVA